jgi:hypothetical protein
VLAERLGRLAEGHRGHRQIVNQLRIAAQRLTRLVQGVEEAARAFAGKAAAGEEHPLGKGIPCLRFRLRAELGERVMDVGAEVFVPDVAAAVAHEPPLPGQQALQGQLVERRKHHPLGQVARRAEQDEYRRLQSGA